MPFLGAFRSDRVAPWIGSFSFGSPATSGDGQSLSSLRAQQRLDRAAFVHCSVALRHLFERQRQIEDLAGIDLPVYHEVDQIGEKAPHRRRSAMKTNVRVEQLLAIELDAVWDAD